MLTLLLRSDVSNCTVERDAREDEVVSRISVGQSDEQHVNPMSNLVRKEAEHLPDMNRFL